MNAGEHKLYIRVVNGEVIAVFSTIPINDISVSIIVDEKNTEQKKRIARSNSFGYC